MKGMDIQWIYTKQPGLYVTQAQMRMLKNNQKPDRLNACARG
jgi:hypothetical protein